jgi:hypothetical protein
MTARSTPHTTRRPRMGVPDLSAGACPPDLSEGLCIGNPALPPRAWDADAPPSLAQAAREACQGCPVLSSCRGWAVSGRGVPPMGVIAGMGQREREAARRARRGTGAQEALGHQHEDDR